MVQEVERYGRSEAGRGPFCAASTFRRFLTPTLSPPIGEASSTIHRTLPFTHSAKLVRDVQQRKPFERRTDLVP
jgi:hypothetical protein